jgi:hypothetical protein
MNLTRVLHLPLLRKPLFLMVVLESLLVLGVVATAWHVWQSRHDPSAPAVGGLPAPRLAPDTEPARLAPPSGPPAPTAGTPPSPPARQAPGFRFDADFVTGQLRDINREQAGLEQVEWRLVRAAVQGMKSYLERVVIPRVERAEGRSR